jgi:hypothetical protein
VVRVAAFVHRLLVVALALADAAAAAALVATTRALLAQYPPVRQLLEGDDDRAVRGTFRAAAPAGEDVDDSPELSNPLSAAAWEVSLLGFHWHPTVRAQAKACAALAAPGSSDNAVHTHRDLARAPVFYPPWRLPLPHPLHATLKRHLGAPARRRHLIFLRNQGRAVTAVPSEAVEEAVGAAPRADSGRAVAPREPFKQWFRAVERFRIGGELQRHEAVDRRLREARDAWGAIKKKQKT